MSVRQTPVSLPLSAADARYLKLDQTTPQTTVGTFTFPKLQLNTGTISDDLFSWLTSVGGIENSGSFGYCTSSSSHGVTTDITRAAQFSGLGIHASLTASFCYERQTSSGVDVWYSGTFTDGVQTVVLCDETRALFVGGLTQLIGVTETSDGLTYVNLNDGTYAINSVGNCNFGAGNILTTGTLGAGATTITSLSLNDTNTQITEDGSGNMILKDAVAGSIALVELSCPPLVTGTESTVAEGNNNVTLSPVKSKVLIKYINVVTTSTDWTLTLYTKDDFATGAMVVVTNRSGNYNVYLDYPYEDADASGELHYNFTSASGSETHDIEIRGYALR